jgi:hypothetical protein
MTGFQAPLNLSLALAKLYVLQSAELRDPPRRPSLSINTWTGEYNVREFASRRERNEDSGLGTFLSFSFFFYPSSCTRARPLGLGLRKRATQSLALWSLKRGGGRVVVVRTERERGSPRLATFVGHSTDILELLLGTPFPIFPRRPSRSPASSRVRAHEPRLTPRDYEVAVGRREVVAAETRLANLPGQSSSVACWPEDISGRRKFVGIRRGIFARMIYQGGKLTFTCAGLCPGLWGLPTHTG